MPESMAVYLGAALLLLSSIVVAQDDCSLTPIYLDFHDRRVDGGISVQYGLFTGIGSPSQNLSQWPSLSNNETSVGSLDYCTGSPFADCVALSHGFYEPTLSEDYDSSATYQTLDTNIGDVPATLAEYAIDTFNLFVHYFDPSPPTLSVVPDFPVTVFSNYSSSSTPWFGPAGLFGLGPSSTILRHASDLGLISTRSYGLYMGTAYREANGSINGSLTLGGYDSGRFEGEVHSYPIGTPNPAAKNSPFSITISQMTLTDNDGEDTDLLDNAFAAYLSTDQYEINLPGAVLDKFAEETGAQAENERYQLPDSFNSSLTVTLSSGLNLTFEPEWLKNVSNNSPFSSTASDSTSSSDNSTTTSSNGPAILGSAFFSHIYMMVNYDAATEPTFYLAAARPHGPYVMTQTICADTIPTAAASTNISSFAASGMAGAIVGGVVGGIGLTFLCWWLFRRYAQRRMWDSRRRMAMKGKSVEGGNMPIGAGAARPSSKSKGSPSSFASSSVENLHSTPDERQRPDSSEMANFAFDFNDGLPRGWQNQNDSSVGDPNSANSPASFMESRYADAIVAREMKPSLVQVQPQTTHHPHALRASIYNNDGGHDGYARSPPITPLTAQPLMSSNTNNNNNSTSARNGGAGPDMYAREFMSPVSPPSATTATMGGAGGGSFGSRVNSDSTQRQNLPALQTEFAGPPRREVLRPGEKAEAPRKESLLRKVLR